MPLDDSDDKIQFGIWDTAGSERYKALAPMYYRGAEAAIVVYDITSFESFEGAKSWARHAAAAPRRALLRHSRLLLRHRDLRLPATAFAARLEQVHDLKLYGQPHVVIALAANKSDLEQYRVVTTQEGQAYARENEMSYFETSAKTGHNVRRMFVDLAQCVPRKVRLADTACYGEEPLQIMFPRPLRNQNAVTTYNAVRNWWTCRLSVRGNRTH